MPAFDKKLDQTKCVGCGQCAAVCTTGAITVKNQIGQAWQASTTPRTGWWCRSPRRSGGLGEEFGLPAGANVMDKLVKALKLMGVEEVYDTNFAADMTTISETRSSWPAEKRRSLPYVHQLLPGLGEVSGAQRPQVSAQHLLLQVPHGDVCRRAAG